MPGQCLGTIAGRGDKIKTILHIYSHFFIPGEDVYCDDKSDSNKLAKDGQCETKVKPCVATLIRPVPLEGKCQDYLNYLESEFPDFDYDSNCTPEKREYYSDPDSDDRNPDYDLKCVKYVDFEEFRTTFDFESECNTGTEICVEENSPSKCDRHPQCEDGEDEFGCEKEYERKGFFKETETFRCNLTYTFPNWTLYTHRAFRCDGDPTCPYGEDEEDCQILTETIKFIIRK